MKDGNDFFDDMIDDEMELEDAALMEFDEAESEDDEEEEFIETRAAILSKKGMVALLSLKTFASGGQIVRVDPRQSLPTAQNYEDSEAALSWYKRSLATSKRNGWQVVYDGEPLFG